MSLREKRLLVGLLISIGVNLFVLGFLAARFSGPRGVFRGGPPHAVPSLQADPHQGALGLFHARELFGANPPPSAHALLHKHGADLKPRRQALRAAHKQVRRALEAEPLDREQLHLALAELRKETQQMQAGLHGALVDLAAELSPEQRRELVRKHWRGRGDSPRH